MNKLFKAILCYTALGAWLLHVPFVSQVYAKTIWPRRMNLMYGRFDSFEAAEAFVDRTGKVGWNDQQLAEVLIEGARSDSVEALKVQQTSQFAVMLWMTKLLRQDSSVVDFGGAGGVFFETCQDYGLLDPSMRWHVVDMPEVVSQGEARHAELGSTGITFGTDLAAAPAADILLALGSLQYMQDPLGEKGPGVLETMGSLPRSILINKIPLIDGDDIWTAQNHVSTASPYRLFNRKKFVAYFERHGYRQADRWSVPELTVEIPFHPQHAMTALEGLYFTRDA